jgi:hypothetical protein
MYIELEIETHDIGLDLVSHPYTILVSAKVTVEENCAPTFSEWYLPELGQPLNFGNLDVAAQRILIHWATQDFEAREAATFDDERRGPA